MSASAVGGKGKNGDINQVPYIMKTQSHQGDQANSILVARTSIDWHYPVSTLSIMDVIEEAAKLHSGRRRNPISKENCGLSRVMTRLREDRGRIP